MKSFLRHFFSTKGTPCDAMEEQLILFCPAFSPLRSCSLRSSSSLWTACAVFHSFTNFFENKTFLFRMVNVNSTHRHALFTASKPCSRFASRFRKHKDYSELVRHLRCEHAVQLHHPDVTYTHRVIVAQIPDGRREKIWARHVRGKSTRSLGKQL